MADLQLRARLRLGWSDERDRAAYEQVKAVLQAAHETLAPGTPFFPQVLGREEDWEVPTPLVFESHRGRAGRLIVFLKKRLLFPLNRWLHSYVWHNLQRQQKLNLLLLSAVEALAISHARLRQEVEERHPGVETPSDDPAEQEQLPQASAPLHPGPMRLAFVVDRYGPDVPGGSERHCREFATRLAERGHAVTVLTSCARDYVSWANAFPPGEERDGSVRVLRFPVAAERDQRAWHDHSRRVFAGLGSEEDEQRWFRESGPYVPGLLEYLQQRRDEHDLFVFFSYRYHPTFAGLPLVASRAILVPTAEEDPAIRLGALRRFFTLPLGILHNSLEEHRLLKRVTGGRLPAFQVIGCGVAEPEPRPDEKLLERLGVQRPYLLYLGRIDPNKGCAELVEHFRRYLELEKGPLRLVLAGHSVFDVPRHPAVRVLGHVSEGECAALLHYAHAVVVPSPFESLSLTLLEAWMQGRPAVVNGWCKVLRGQVERANGGVYYDNAAEFRECLAYLVRHPEVAARLGNQGREHARREYAWPVVMERLETFLRERLAAASEG